MTYSLQIKDEGGVEIFGDECHRSIAEHVLTHRNPIFQESLKECSRDDGNERVWRGHFGIERSGHDRCYTLLTV